MRFSQLLQSIAVVSVTTIVASSHARLREICAEQVRTIGFCRDELARLTKQHREEVLALKAINEEQNAWYHRELMGMQMDYKAQLSAELFKLCGERGIKYDDDATLSEMEIKLLAADRRSGQRTKAGSSNVSTRRNRRNKPNRY